MAKKRNVSRCASLAGACALTWANSGTSFVAPLSTQATPAASQQASQSSADVRSQRCSESAGSSKGAMAIAAGAAVAAASLSAAQRSRVTRRAQEIVDPESFSGVCEQTGVTLNRYMIEANKRGVIDTDIQSVFNSIREATKVISKLVSNAPLSQAELLGLQGEINVQGEDQKKLDVITNDVLKKALQYTGKLGTMASEEEDEPVAGSYQDTTISSALASKNNTVLADTGKYVCVFDPLDGSSNVDAGIAVGTIFGIFKEPDDMAECDIPEISDLTEEQAACLAGTLQPGKALVAAGYVLYSCSTEMVFTLGKGCVGFTLDTSIGEYVLTRPHIRIPARGSIYSCNEANIGNWDEPMRQYIEDIQSGKGETGKKYSLRYIGSMVGDVHRTLLYGGLFAYPADAKNEDGKLRLLYEAAPMAFILEQAGGKAITGHSRVMEIPPTNVHQRVPVILGSKEDVEECQRYYEKSGDPTLRARCENRLKGLVTA